MCAAHVNNFSSNLVERVDFIDSRVALLWACLYVFPNQNNIELKCSFVRCRKYHKSWSNGAAKPHISVLTLWHNGCQATQLGRFTLWHNGRRTKPGLMLLKDERFERFSKHRSMYALRRFNKLFKRWTLYEDRISDRSKPLKDERRGNKNHHMS